MDNTTTDLGPFWSRLYDLASRFIDARRPLMRGDYASEEERKALVMELVRVEQEWRDLVAEQTGTGSTRLDLRALGFAPGTPLRKLLERIVADMEGTEAT